MERPESVEALAALVPRLPRIRLHGGGSKPGLSAPDPTATTVDLGALSGIVEYRPEECTFTALAATPVRDLDTALARHGHHLPFDPPLVDAGATIGGTVAAGINGSCRYRFGGIRDFIIGARVVDGQGRILHSGGKVVKNAAGFLLHQALVGSCGRLGALTEVTFKIFPAAEVHATLRIPIDGVAAALDLMTALQRTRLDLEALDLLSPSTVCVRIGGFAEAMPARVEALRRGLVGDVELLEGDDDAQVWRDAREFAWAAGAETLVRVPITPPAVARFDAAVERLDARRRYGLAGNLALVATAASPAQVDALLTPLGLTGQVLRGATVAPFIGAPIANPVDARLRAVMDPEGRFSVPAFADTE
jgi:glycolate oxidase FAD binding subunit